MSWFWYEKCHDFYAADYKNSFQGSMTLQFWGSDISKTTQHKNQLISKHKFFSTSCVHQLYMPPNLKLKKQHNKNKNNKVFTKVQNLFHRDYSKSTRTHTHKHTLAPTHASILTIQNLIYTQLKRAVETRWITRAYAITFFNAHDHSPLSIICATMPTG